MAVPRASPTSCADDGGSALRGNFAWASSSFSHAEYYLRQASDHLLRGLSEVREMIDHCGQAANGGDRSINSATMWDEINKERNNSSSNQKQQQQSQKIRFAALDRFAVALKTDIGAVIAQSSAIIGASVETSPSAVVCAGTAVSVYSSLLHAIAQLSSKFSGLDADIAALRAAAPQVVTFCSQPFAEFQQSLIDGDHYSGHHHHSNSTRSPPHQRQAAAAAGGGAASSSSTAASPSRSLPPLSPAVLDAQQLNLHNSQNNNNNGDDNNSEQHPRKKRRRKRRSRASGASDGGGGGDDGASSAAATDDEAGGGGAASDDVDVRSSVSATFEAMPTPLGDFLPLDAGSATSVEVCLPLSLRSVLRGVFSPFAQLLRDNMLRDAPATVRLPAGGGGRSTASSPGAALHFIAEQCLTDVLLEGEIASELSIPVLISASSHPVSSSSSSSRNHQPPAATTLTAALEWKDVFSSSSSAAEGGSGAPSRRSASSSSILWRQVQLRGRGNLWISILGVFREERGARFALRQDVFQIDGKKIETVMLLREVEEGARAGGGGEHASVLLACKQHGGANLSNDPLGLAFLRVYRDVVVASCQQANAAQQEATGGAGAAASSSGDATDDLQHVQLRKRKSRRQQQREAEEGAQGGGGILRGLLSAVAAPVVLVAEGASELLRDQQHALFRRQFPHMADDEIIDCFNCALSDESSTLLQQGILFLTRRHCAFSATVLSAKFALEWSDVRTIEKRSYGIFDNSLELVTMLSQTYFLTSFLARDEAHHLCFDLWTGRL